MVEMSVDFPFETREGLTFFVLLIGLHEYCVIALISHEEKEKDRKV